MNAYIVVSNLLEIARQREHQAHARRFEAQESAMVEVGDIRGRAAVLTRALTGGYAASLPASLIHRAA